jgi:hypothetical protein
MVATACLLTQVLLTFHPTTTGPLRFGVPLPAKALARGLRLQSTTGARLQWQPLQAGQDPQTGRTWVEVCITGARGTSRILAGGRAATAGDAGPVVRRSLRRRAGEECTVWTETFVWHGGERDRLVRTVFHQRHVHESGERFAPGEGFTTWSPGFLDRSLGAGIPGRLWRAARVVPGSGALAGRYRERLGKLARSLAEAPGLRGRGDYRRSGAVLTNLEFDTTLGLARMGLALGDRELLGRAWRSALHLVDMDLDARTGLAFAHGRDHRAGAPDPGHTWLQGLLLTGCLFADRQLIHNARRMAVGVATHPVSRTERRDRLRDHGWPLLELESWLRFEDNLEVRRAADAIAAGVKRRWDPLNQVVTFGEGRRRGGVYEMRVWLQGGVLLPALRRHLERTHDPQIRQIVLRLGRRLHRLVQSGRPGIPTHCWLRGGEVLREARPSQRPRCFLVLEGLESKALKRLVGRQMVRKALDDIPRVGDQDLPTSFSIVARCDWVYR